MGANYILLETITVGEAGASSVTFNNIPQSGYTDVKVVYSVRTTGGSGQWMNLSLSFNGLTTNWSNKYLYGTGSAAGSNGTSTNFYAAGVGNPSTTTANTFSSGELYVPNFAGSNAKSVSYDTVTENNGTSALIQSGAALWNSTAAITSLTIAPESGVGNFAQYSTFSLYGLAAVGTTPVIAPYASGGDIIQTDGTYWYHAFLSSGTFTPAKGLSCNYVMVAGGGGSGGGGAGAGGLLTNVGGAALSVTSNTAYTVVIGAGGTGANSNYVDPTGRSNGGNTTFASLTAIGGGGGGTGSEQNASNPNTAMTGGSGGGAVYSSGNGNYGAGTTGQGYAGGLNSYHGSPYSGAGGGGAGSAGNGNQSDSVAGAGGVGIYNAVTDGFGTLSGIGQLSGGHYYFAGGGGGGVYFASTGTKGAGGLGGGAAGGETNGLNATPNTGGGAGGGSNGYSGAKGGSGIVIVRYAI